MGGLFPRISAVLGEFYEPRKSEPGFVQECLELVMPEEFHQNFPRLALIFIAPDLLPEEEKQHQKKKGKKK